MLLLNLFPDVLLPVVVDEIIANASGSRTLRGKIAADPEGTVDIVVRAGVVAGHVMAHGAHFVIEPLGGDEHLIYELEVADLRPEAPPRSVPPGTRVDYRAPSPARAADDGSIFDVLIAYTPSARASRGGTAAVEAIIEAAVAWSNTAYSRSGVTPRMNLVYMVEVPYTESASGMGDDLDRLKATTDGYMDEVHSLRDSKAADLVHLITENAPYDYCGIAWFAAWAEGGAADFGFGVTDARCLPSTLAHELGHNQGSHHDRYVATGSPAYSYSYGFVDTVGQFLTIMSYHDLCADSGVSCTAIQNFSNPNVVYDGRPTGIAFDAADSADNRRSINNTALTIANFRESVPDQLAAPTLVSPTGPSSDAAPTYTWDSVENADSYRLWINAGLGNIHKSWYQAADICSGTTCTVESPPAPGLSQGDHQWFVRAWNSAGVGPWSDALDFTVTPNTPGRPYLSSPDGSSSNSAPNYKWNTVSGATDYYVWINTGSSNIYKSWHSAASACVGGTCQVATPPAPNLAVGTYTWWVRSWNSDGYGPWSDAMDFTITANTPGRPYLIAPEGAIAGNTPTYRWNAVSGATNYYLWINDGSGNIHKAWYSAAAACVGGTCSVDTPPAPNLAAGGHAWWVRSWNADGYGPWSDGMSFTAQ